MPLSIRLATGLKPIKSLKVRDGGAVLRTINHAYVRTASGLKQFFSTFSVVASSAVIFGVGYSRFGGTTTVTSSSVTATATGGNGIVSYAWSRSSGSTAINAVTPNSATTQFRATIASDTELDAVFICTATDASGQTATTGSVNVTMRNNSL